MDTELAGGRVVLMTTSPLNLTSEKWICYTIVSGRESPQ